MKVKDLLDLVKEDGFLVEIDNTETDFQYVLDVAEAIWSYGGVLLRKFKVVLQVAQR